MHTKEAAILKGEWHFDVGMYLYIFRIGTSIFLFGSLSYFVYSSCLQGPQGISEAFWQHVWRKHNSYPQKVHNLQCRMHGGQGAEVTVHFLASFTWETYAIMFYGVEGPIHGHTGLKNMVYMGQANNIIGYFVETTEMGFPFVCCDYDWLMNKETRLTNSKI